MKTTLYENEWLSLEEIVDKERGINGYIYSHESRCNGRIVAVLPFKRKNKKIWILMRREVTPCWGTEFIDSAITGGYDDPILTLKQTAIKELKEEAGYEADESELISLGESRGTKSSDTLYTLFAIDVTGKERKELTKDSEMEESKGSTVNDNACCIWKSEPISWDPFVAQMYVRLLCYLDRDNQNGCV